VSEQHPSLDQALRALEQDDATHGASADVTDRLRSEVRAIGRARRLRRYTAWSAAAVLIVMASMVRFRPLESPPLPTGDVTTALFPLSFGDVVSAQAQTSEFLWGNTTTGPIIRDAPFSADGLTTISQTLADGTRIERHVPTRLYRDSRGRVRREQTVARVTLTPSSDAMEAVVLVDPVEGFTYTLNASTRTAHRAPLAKQASSSMPPPPPPPPPPTATSDASTPPPPLPPPTRPVETSLGTRDIDGLAAIGTRHTLTIPVGGIGNDRPISAVNERWVSRDLRVLLSSRYEDPRMGVVSFRLMNVRRAEPAPSLFQIPAGYTVIDAAAPRSSSPSR
jgi:hypothetical protein